jgi:pimeloyl-ACP methyl ester carboxylesterase
MNNRNDVSRRQTLAMLAAAPFTAVAAGAAEADSSRRARSTPVVLVHGAWHGGWCWSKLAPLLRAASHQVFAPTLTGLGERVHQLAADVGLGTHVQDVTALLEYEDLRDVILVGHSYGGMVIAGVAAAAAPRVAKLVYLDAFLPEHGKSVKDYAPLPPTRADGWRVASPATAQQFGVTNVQDAAWVDQRLGDQPLRTFTDPAKLVGSSLPPARQSFVQCSETPWFREAGERARRMGFHYRALLTAGHDAMITQPRERVGLLTELV